MGNKCCTCKESNNSGQEVAEQRNSIPPPYPRANEPMVKEEAKPPENTDASASNKKNDSPTIRDEDDSYPYQDVNLEQPSETIKEFAQAPTEKYSERAPSPEASDYTFPHVSMTKIMAKIKKEEGFHKGWKLLDIVSTENIMSEDPNKVIYEGELLKFSPGLKQQYYPKWAQITKCEFRYYKDRLSAAEWLARPLVVLPLHLIERVERVSVKIATKNPGKASKSPYQFEILIKNTKGNRARSTGRNQEESANNSISQKSPSSPSLYGSQMKKSALAGVAIQNKKSYMEYVKNKAPALSKVVMQQNIKGQGPSSWIKSLSGADTWTNREKIWQNIKERHVYAHADKMECEKWVFVLNWVIDVLNSSQ